MNTYSQNNGRRPDDEDERRRDELADRQQPLTKSQAAAIVGCSTSKIDWLRKNDDTFPPDIWHGTRSLRFNKGLLLDWQAAQTKPRGNK